MASSLDALYWPWSPWLLVVALAVAIGAGVVRGYSGFGFSALVVAGLSPFVPPGPLVVAVLTLEMLASARLVGASSGMSDPAWQRALLIGNFLFVPVGVAALVWLPPNELRWIVGAAMLLGAVSLRITVNHGMPSTWGLRALAGAGSGLLNGLAASGGIVAALLMAATRPPPSILRATMIVFLLWISAYALLWSGLMSLVKGSSLWGFDALRWILILAPAMWIGMRIGTRAFDRASPQSQRVTVLNILIVTSGVGLALAVSTR